MSIQMDWAGVSGTVNEPFWFSLEILEEDPSGTSWMSQVHLKRDFVQQG